MATKRLSRARQEKNDERAGRAENALDTWRAGYRPDEGDLSDLLCDLMHYARGEKQDFMRELARAQDSFRAELDPDDDIEEGEAIVFAQQRGR